MYFSTLSPWTEQNTDSHSQPNSVRLSVSMFVPYYFFIPWRTWYMVSVRWVSAWLFTHAVCKIGLYKRYFSVHLSTKVLCSPFKQQSKSHIRPMKRVKLNKKVQKMFSCFINFLEFIPFFPFTSHFLFASNFSFSLYSKKLNERQSPQTNKILQAKRLQIP
jgi:hypothetical protein